MESVSAAALETQRKEHPESGEILDKLQAQTNSKLYHQLTKTLLEYLQSPPFDPSKAGAAKQLSDFFDGFIRQFESKFDKVRWVEILSIVSKPQTPEAALELVQSFEASVSGNRDAMFMWQALKAEKLTLAGKLEESKELLESLHAEIEAAYEVDALIQSNAHKAYALLWKKLERPQEFYRSNILFLAFTPLASIPVEERAQLAFEIGVSALIAPDEFDFGELWQQDIVASLDGSNFAWIKDFLQAYSEGKFDMYDAAISKHKAQMDATPELRGKEATVLRPKMAVLALMELAFRKPKKQRRLSFEELATHCRVGVKEVEHLVMKSMSQKLVQGSIDEVAQTVNITWVKPRILDSVRIDLMRERIDAWAAQTGLLLDHLEEVTPELLVS
eukprot:TRINITY_DN37295_c0_g1_i1.p2 TRINITY_DN37295_c0_g1~~TRINITY_DN37295_c0_g1_i1.p2  ORF type:complete len:389 (+),score=125.80 TRINITY_DN37295_c0_g1_i1:93-1259(+)